MTLHEYVGNMHVHTPYSDGTAYHNDIAEAALLAGLDFVIVTDHNIRVRGVEGYYGDSQRGYVLLLTGEEVHNRSRQPTANHCLVYGADREMAPYAHQPQTLINEVKAAGGLSFLAHPDDCSLSWTRTAAGAPWENWSIEGFHGIEIWNFMSCFKALATTPWQALRHAFTPEQAVCGPNPATLARWDALLASGRRVVGIGGANAHGRKIRFGPLSHTVFRYDFLFNCVNTHLLTASPLVGELDYDQTLLYRALRLGRVFISYQMLGSARGFRFTAQGGKGGTRVEQGGSIRLQHGVTLQVMVPRRAHIKMIHNGDVATTEENVENLTYVARKPGAYRVEVWRHDDDQDRCWILSNPIYVEPNISPIAVQDTLPQVVGPSSEE